MFQVKLRGELGKLVKALGDLGLANHEITISIVLNSNEEVFKIIAVAVSQGIAVEIQPIEQKTEVEEKKARLQLETEKPKPKPRVEAKTEEKPRKEEVKKEEAKREEIVVKTQTTVQQKSQETVVKPTVTVTKQEQQQEAREKEDQTVKVSPDHVFAISEIDFQKLVAEKEKAFARRRVEEEE